MNANPPLDAAPAAISAMFDAQTGHIALVLSFLAGSLVRLLQIRGQTIKRAFPESSVLFDPLSGLFERLRVQFHFMDAAIAPPPEQPGFLQNAQMFRDRGKRHGVRAGEMGDAMIAAGEMGQDPAAGGIGQGCKRSVQCARIFNHLVNY
jgi:hypothetical protein